MSTAEGSVAKGIGDVVIDGVDEVVVADAGSGGASVAGPVLRSNHRLSTLTIDSPSSPALVPVVDRSVSGPGLGRCGGEVAGVVAGGGGSASAPIPRSNPHVFAPTPEPTDSSLHPVVDRVPSGVGLSLGGADLDGDVVATVAGNGTGVAPVSDAVRRSDRHVSAPTPEPTNSSLAPVVDRGPCGVGLSLGGADPDGDVVATVAGSGTGVAPVPDAVRRSDRHVSAPITDPTNSSLAPVVDRGRRGVGTGLEGADLGGDVVATVAGSGTGVAPVPDAVRRSDRHVSAPITDPTHSSRASVVDRGRRGVGLSLGGDDLDGGVVAAVAGSGTGVAPAADAVCRSDRHVSAPITDPTHSSLASVVDRGRRGVGTGLGGAVVDSDGVAVAAGSGTGVAPAAHAVCRSDRHVSAPITDPTHSSRASVVDRGRRGAGTGPGGAGGDGDGVAVAASADTGVAPVARPSRRPDRHVSAHAPDASRSSHAPTVGRGPRDVDAGRDGAGGSGVGGRGGRGGDGDPGDDDDGSSSESSDDASSAAPSLVSSSESDDDVADVGAGQGLSRAQLRERLREAIDRAHVKAGRVTNADKAAAETLAVMAARMVRRARMQAAAPAARFPWRHVVRQHSATTQSPLEVLTSILGSSEDAAQLLREPEPPASPPPPEAEAEGDDGDVPTPLPRSTEWWQEERARQASAPFVAGGLGPVRLEFRPEERPAPPAGSYFRWGQVLRTAELAEQARKDLARMLAKDLRSGAISVVADSEVDCVTPIFIVYHPVTLKARLVHDLRAVNARLVAASAHVPRVTEALAGLSYAAKLDLAQAFRHVAVDDRDKRVLGFQVDGAIFRWNALPFGAGQSPAFFASALAECLRKLPPSVRVVVYVDDILVIAESKEQLDASFLSLCKTLRGGGWTVALDKSYPYAHSRIPFLGLLVHLAPGEQHVLVSKAKATRLRELCTKALSQVVVSLRDVQRITGLLAFFGLAAPEARLARKGLDAAAAEAERLPGRTVGVKGALRADLEFWKNSAMDLPAMPPMPAGADREVIVCTDAAGLPSLGFGGIAWPGNATAPDVEVALGNPTDYKAKFRQDVKVGDARVFSGPLPSSAASMSSAGLEVLAFRTVLNLLSSRVPLRGCTILWFCDSTSAVASAAKWRAKSPGLARELRLLLADCRRIGVRLIPRWVSRDLGWQPLADALSKIQWRRNSPEWCISRQWFATISGGIGWSPDVDLFAAPGNNVTDKYATEYPSAGAWTDAFARSWSGLRAWMFPPFSAATAAFRHMCRASDCRVLAVIPRVTCVPPRLRVISRAPAPTDLRLCDPQGNTADLPCPVQLDVVDVSTPDIVVDGGAGS